MSKFKTLVNRDMAIPSQDISNSIISSKSTDSNENYITTRDAAVMLGVTIRTIQNWVDSGKLFAKITLGGHRRLLLSEVEALINQHSPQPSANQKNNHTNICA